MLEVCGTIILIGLCLLISYWENLRYNTYITPFSALAWPYVIVVVLINFAGVHLGFFPVSLRSNSFVFLGFLFFLMGGVFILSLVKGRIADVDYNKRLNLNLETFFNLYRPLFVVIAILSIIAGFIHFRFSLAEVGGWINIATNDFKDVYGTGLLAHIKILSRLSFIFLFADYFHRKRKYIFILLFLMFLIVFVRQVKYQILGMILGGFYFAMLKGCIKFSLRKLAFYSILIFILFNLTYYLGFIVAGVDYAFAERTHMYLLNHFFTYLFGGPIGFSEILNQINYPIYSLKEIFAVPINILNFLFQYEDYVDIIISYWIPVSTHTEMFHSSNVFGIVGMLFMYLGPYGALLYMFFLGSIAYGLMALSFTFPQKIGAQLVYSFVMALLTVSFFDIYFNKLVAYEASFFMFVIPPIYYQMRNGLKKAISYHRKKYQISS